LAWTDSAAACERWGKTGRPVGFATLAPGWTMSSDKDISDAGTLADLIHEYLPGIRRGVV
jgi:hypothetical protein